jgi:protein-disulfide isomerase
MNRIALYAASLLIALPLCAPAFAQNSAPPNTGTTFKDTSILHSPPGVRVAIIEFEDLECPACAHAFPIVRAAAAHYKIPLLHHDFPLHMHIWSLDAAITARYMQDKISPEFAEEYRRTVFANQNSIASKEDLQAFTQHFFQTHGREMPFVVDPTGQFAREVHADYELGERVGLTQTPTIFVVTPHHWTQVTDVSLLYQTIDTALAETPAAASSKMRRNTKQQR